MKLIAMPPKGFPLIFRAELSRTQASSDRNSNHDYYFELRSAENFLLTHIQCRLTASLGRLLVWQPGARAASPGVETCFAVLG